MISNVTKNKLKAIDMWLLRKMLKISRIKKKTNESVLEMDDWHTKEMAVYITEKTASNFGHEFHTNCIYFYLAFGERLTIKLFHHY